MTAEEKRIGYPKSVSSFDHRIYFRWIRIIFFPEDEIFDSVQVWLGGFTGCHGCGVMQGNGHGSARFYFQLHMVRVRLSLRVRTVCAIGRPPRNSFASVLLPAS